MGTIERDEIESKVADGNVAMDVDCAEVREKAPLVQEEEQANNSQKMEVDGERPPVSYDEHLEETKEEGSDSVDIEVGDGKNHDVNIGVGDDAEKAEVEPLLDCVPHYSPEEKESDKASLSNGSKNGGSLSSETQMGGSVLSEERDEKPGKSSNVGTKMEGSGDDEHEKDGSPYKLDNDAEGLEASVYKTGGIEQ